MNAPALCSPIIPSGHCPERGSGLYLYSIESPPSRARSCHLTYLLALLQTFGEEGLGSSRNADLIDSLLSKAESGNLFTIGSGKLTMPMLSLPCSKLLLYRCLCLLRCNLNTGVAATKSALWCACRRPLVCVSMHARS